MTANSIRYREAKREVVLRPQFRSEEWRRLLWRPARDLLPKKFAEFGDATIGVGQMFGDSRLCSALRLQNPPVLLDDFEVLLFPERLIKESPIGSLPSPQVAIPQEIHERAVFINRSSEAEDTQNAFWAKRQRNIKSNPQRLAAIEFRPIEIHTALSLTFNDEAIVSTPRAHIVFERAAGKRQRLPVEKGTVHRVCEVFQDQDPVCLPFSFANEAAVGGIL